MTKKEKALQDSKENFESCLQDMISMLKNKSQQLKDTDFSDYYDFLSYKASIVDMLLGDLPLGEGTCPFCQENRDDAFGIICHKCEYQKTHGLCGQDGSAYRIILRLVGMLSDVLTYVYSQKDIDKGKVMELKEKAYGLFKQFDLLLCRY